MTRKLEEFKPLQPGKVGFYSCGPTVYHYTHLGNLRTFLHNDFLKRMFLANGYDVRHIMNITDVGHLTNDEDDSGEDKMEKGAARDNKSVWDIAKFYKDEFMRDFNDLNMIAPTVMPHATDYIAEQIELVQKLQELGYAYEIPKERSRAYPRAASSGNRGWQQNGYGDGRVGDCGSSSHPEQFYPDSRKRASADGRGCVFEYVRKCAARYRARENRGGDGHKYCNPRARGSDP
jgi:cysteinyl-tRNA synthetase